MKSNSQINRVGIFSSYLFGYIHQFTADAAAAVFFQHPKIDDFRDSLIGKSSLFRPEIYVNIAGNLSTVVSGKGDCLAVLLVLQALIIFLWTGIDPALSNFFCRAAIGIFARL